jgi:hypothetical protein
VKSVFVLLTHGSSVYCLLNYGSWSHSSWPPLCFVKSVCVPSWHKTYAYVTCFDLHTALQKLVTLHDDQNKTLSLHNCDLGGFKSRYLRQMTQQHRHCACANSAWLPLPGCDRLHMRSTARCRSSQIKRCVSSQKLIALAPILGVRDATGGFIPLYNYPYKWFGDKVSRAPMFICDAKETLSKIYVTNVEIVMKLRQQWAVTWRSTQCQQNKWNCTHTAFNSCINIQVTYSGALAHILTVGLRSRDSSVDIVTTLRDAWPTKSSFECRKGKRFFFSPKRRDGSGAEVS